MKKYTLLLGALLVVSVSDIEAQQQHRDGGGRSRGGPEQRTMLERQLQARIDSIIRVRLSPTDEQFNQLRDVATRIERERRQLRMEESQTRMEMRKEMSAATVNEDKVAELLARLPRMERRRLELHEREQRELSRFLAPSQRAQYYALQDELRRTMQETMRSRLGLDQRGAPGKPGPPGRIPPPR